MKMFSWAIGIWDIVQIGFSKPTEDMKLSSNVIKELERNKHSECKAFHYLSIIVKLHVV